MARGIVDHSIRFLKASLTGNKAQAEHAEFIFIGEEEKVLKK